MTAVVQFLQIRSLKDSIHNPRTGYIARLERSAANLATCRGNVAELRSGVDSQNESIRRSAELAATQAALGQALLTEARRVTTTAQQRAAAIAAAQPGEDVCASADDLIIESLEE